jgi:hypothetical protein
MEGPTRTVRYIIHSPPLRQARPDNYVETSLPAGPDLLVRREFALCMNLVILRRVCAGGRRALKEAHPCSGTDRVDWLTLQRLLSSRAFPSLGKIG